jgi:hypothetical protein
MIGDCYFARFFRVDVLMMGTFTGFEGPAIVQNNPLDFLKLYNLIIRTMRIKCQGDYGRYPKMQTNVNTFTNIYKVKVFTGTGPPPFLVEIRGGHIYSPGKGGLPGMPRSRSGPSWSRSGWKARTSYTPPYPLAAFTPKTMSSRRPFEKIL